jgi:glycosyltransferase involved in cell wall biosynthesis
VGRLAADKGFQYAIQAIEKLTGEHGDVRLLILGEDFGAKAELIGGIPEGIRHRIIFGGHAERETVLREMSRAVAVLIPSLSEPFGLVALEALSVGAVVIASRSGALPEIIEHERSGLLVEPRSARGLAEAVIRVLKDEQLAQLLRVNASARAGDFSTKVAAAKYLDVFERVVPENF